MKSTVNTKRFVWTAAVAGLCVVLFAFRQEQQKQRTPSPQINQDTIPKKKELKIHDLDEVLDEANDADLDVNMKKLNIELAKIGPLVQKELANARIELKNAIKEVEIAGINDNINAALEKIDFEKINKEINASVKAVDLAELNKELEQVKKINVKEINEEIQRLQPELQKNLKKIKVDVEKVKTELREYKSFVNGLDDDGLINKKGEFTIKHRNGELIINGTVQPEAVYNKYRYFLEKHKTLTIEKSDDDFNIDVD
jgi:hypothetical protein